MATLTKLPSSASITWDLVTPPGSPTFPHLTVPTSVSSLTLNHRTIQKCESHGVPNNTDRATVNIQRCMTFSYVRLVCSDDGSEGGDGGGVGPLSEEVTLALPNASMFCLAS